MANTCSDFLGNDPIMNRRRHSKALQQTPKNRICIQDATAAEINRRDVRPAVCPVFSSTVGTTSAVAREGYVGNKMDRPPGSLGRSSRAAIFSALPQIGGCCATFRENRAPFALSVIESVAKTPPGFSSRSLLRFRDCN